MKTKNRKRDFQITINKENEENSKVKLYPGENSIAANTADSSRTVNNGIFSASISTGRQSVVTNTGYQSVAVCTGYKSTAVCVCNQSVALSVCNESTAKVESEESIAIVTGKDSKASGALGCWLVLTEITKWNVIKEVKAVRVDGETIKPNTWYKLVDGQIIEAE